MASPTIIFCMILSLSLFSIVSAKWIKIDRWNIPSEAGGCYWRPDSSTLLREGKCLYFGNNYAVTASVSDDGSIVVGNCTDSYCAKCTYTTYDDDACDNEDGVRVSTDDSLPFTQYYGYTTVFYTGAKCSDTPVGAFIDNNNYNDSCSLPSGTPCNNLLNTKDFCTIPEDLFVSPKGPNFSQKFNPDASFLVASVYASKDCGGKEASQVIQQLENCMVASSSSTFFKVENGKLFMYECDDEVCGACTPIQMPEKQCVSRGMFDKRSNTGDNFITSVFRPVTDKIDKREKRGFDDSIDDDIDDMQSAQFEVVKGFPKKLAKDKTIVVNYVGLECSGDFNMMMFANQQCMTICFVGIEMSCNIDTLLNKLAPGWGKSGLSTGAIVAIVITVIVVVVVGVVVGIVIYKRNKRGDHGRSYFNQAENSESFPDQR